MQYFSQNSFLQNSLQNSFFNLCSAHFSIIAKKVNQISSNLVCVVACLVFVFCYVLTTDRRNAFQHIFVNQKKLEFDGLNFQTMLFLVTMHKWNNITHFNLLKFAKNVLQE